MKRSRKLSRSGWRDRQKISISAELTVCQKNVANVLDSVGIVLKNKAKLVTFPFFFIVELQNFLNAPRRPILYHACKRRRIAYRPTPNHMAHRMHIRPGDD